MADSCQKLAVRQFRLFLPLCFKHLALEMEVDMLIASENNDGNVELQQVYEDVLSIDNQFQWDDENDDYDAVKE